MNNELLLLSALALPVAVACRVEAPVASMDGGASSADGGDAGFADAGADGGTDAGGDGTDAGYPQYAVTASGAVCDGTTDDTDAIQSAIDAVTAPGGVVTFPAGTCVCNGVKTPATSAVTYEFAGAGMAQTTLLATKAVPAVLALHANGGVSDMTLDGAALVDSVLSATTKGVLLSRIDIARVTTKGVAPNSQGWDLVVWDVNQTPPYQITDLYLTDVTAAGPTSTVQDAMAVSFVDTCHISNLTLTDLYRSPNLYGASHLFANGITVTNVPHVAGLVVDAAVDHAQLSNVSIDAASAGLLVNSPDVQLSSSTILSRTVLGASDVVTPGRSIVAQGSQLTGGVVLGQGGLTGGLASPLAAGTSYPSLSVSPLTPGDAARWPVGTQLLVVASGGQTQLTTIAAALTAGATTIAVNPFVANAAYPVGSNVHANSPFSNLSLTNCQIGAAAGSLGCVTSHLEAGTVVDQVTLTGNHFDTTGASNGWLASAATTYWVTGIIAQNVIQGSAAIDGLILLPTVALSANSGYDPIGPISPPPPVPASGAPTLNATGTDATVTLAGGAVSAIAVGGQTVQLRNPLASGATFTSIDVTPLGGPLAANTPLVLFDGSASQALTCSAAAAAGATTIGVNSFVPATDFTPYVTSVVAPPTAPLSTTSGSVSVPAGQAIVLTYSSAPTWNWSGD